MHYKTVSLLRINNKNSNLTKNKGSIYISPNNTPWALIREGLLFKLRAQGGGVLIGTGVLLGTGLLIEYLRYTKLAKK